jgi:dipeptidase E
MRLLLISSSNVHGHGYLDHAEEEIRAIGAKTVAFVPFALQDHEGYTSRVADRLERMGIRVVPLRKPADLDGAGAIFIGGGNSWRLLKALYDRKLFEPIQTHVRGGLPYIGSSAGTNMAMPTIRTTNDMPIVEPPSWSCFGFVPFQINPHYLDPDPHSTHKGETREERILQFLEENPTPVVGLREASMLRVEDGRITLRGTASARVFQRGTAPYEIEPGPFVLQP